MEDNQMSDEQPNPDVVASDAPVEEKAAEAPAEEEKSEDDSTDAEPEATDKSE